MEPGITMVTRMRAVLECGPGVCVCVCVCGVITDESSKS